MRALVIVNPAAGRTRHLWPALSRRLVRAGLAFDPVVTTGRRDATALARRAVEDGRRLVIAVGGDGTVNEVVNGIVDPEGRFAATLGIVPTGRGRDVSRNLGVARDADEAVRALVSGRDTAVDLGLVEWSGGRRYFVNASGAGFDAEVARHAASSRGGGTIPYLTGVLTALVRHRPVPATVTSDAGAWAGRATAVVVANGAWYGGGMKIAPAAAPTDGMLDLVALGDLGRLELLRWLPALYSGRHVRHPAVTVRRVRQATIETSRPVPVHADGEVIGTTPVRLTVWPHALHVRR